MLAGSIADSKLSTIATGNKVSGSALQLAATSGLEDNTGIRVKVGSALELNVSDEVNVTAGGVTNAMIAAAIDASKIADGSVSNAEFQYLGTVTSNVQTQLDAKLPLAGGTVSGDLNMGDNSITNVKELAHKSTQILDVNPVPNGDYSIAGYVRFAHIQFTSIQGAARDVFMPDPAGHVGKEMSICIYNDLSGHAVYLHNLHIKDWTISGPAISDRQQMAASFVSNGASWIPTAIGSVVTINN